MRIDERDGLDAELLAEIECGGAQGQVPDGGPEVELIAASLADEAVEEMALKVHAEAPLVICVTGMRCEQTAATSLVAA